MTTGTHMHARRSDILAIGLNAAWQKTLFFDRMTKGEVNRAERLLESGGGKATNFARALGSNGRATVLQFAGGHTGKLLCDELDAHSIPHLSVATRRATRTCVTAVCEADGSSTELIEPSAPVAPDELEELQTVLTRELRRFDGVALCGTFPPGVPSALYGDITARAQPHALVLLDAYRDVSSALERGVDVLKINACELMALAAERSLERAAEKCLEKYPVRFLAVTQGEKPAHLFTRQESWRIQAAPLPRVVNAIGAGDCASAVMLSELLDITRAKGRAEPETASSSLAPADVRDAFAQALACAAASCLTPVPGVFDSDRAATLRAQMTIELVPFNV